MVDKIDETFFSHEKDDSGSGNAGTCISGVEAQPDHSSQDVSMQNLSATDDANDVTDVTNNATEDASNDITDIVTTKEDNNVKDDDNVAIKEEDGDLKVVQGEASIKAASYLEEDAKDRKNENATPTEVFNVAASCIK